ncbi:MAG: DUF3800 domain-containing protein [Patescibacteria group bacterium]
MLIFIDDSGDPGFKLDKGSSAFFVIALIIFDDELEAEKVALAIKELRRYLGFPDNLEFKFFKSSKDVREKFLRKVCNFKFRVRAIVIQKSLIRSQELRNSKNSFYGYAIKSVLKHNGGTIQNAKIKIDGSGDRVFRKSFLGYLRRQLNSDEKQIMKSCRLVDSHGNVLIQLADMIAGSIHRSHNVLKDDAKFYKSIIKKRIEDEWFFK